MAELPATFIARLPLRELHAIEPESTIVHINEDDEEPLHVYAYLEGDWPNGLVHLNQGGDLIIIPMESFGQFVSALESLYAT